MTRPVPVNALCVLAKEKFLFIFNINNDTAMKLKHGAHLAYCTNIHRGENWQQTFASLQTHTLNVRRAVCPPEPFAIGLRLSALAAGELAGSDNLFQFKNWLEENNCYVFSVNGFPFGQFHEISVKENVYRPDWASPERLAYTNLLFDILAELLPDGIEGSVSTLPGSFKEFIRTEEQTQAIRDNLWRCVEHISQLSEKKGKKLHLGVEPEPLCLYENSAEVIALFDRLRSEHKNDARLNEFLGVNYDCCHFAIEFEEPATALESLRKAGIRISKIHLSSALKTIPGAEARAALERFADQVYLHQVVAQEAKGTLAFFRDLPDALQAPRRDQDAEWRIHFHVPLHAPAMAPFANTNDHLTGVLDWLGKNPALCSHLEMETYTWDVLPKELKARTVVEQLVAEYEWTLKRLAERGFNRMQE